MVGTAHLCVTQMDLFELRLVHVASKQIGICVLGGQAVLSLKAVEPKGNGGKKVRKECEEKSLALGQRARMQQPVWL